MQIKTQIWEKVSVWRYGDLIIHTDSLEKAKQMYKDQCVISEADDIEFDSFDTAWETMENIDYEYLSDPEFEILEE